MKLSWVVKLLPKSLKVKFFSLVAILSLLSSFAAYIPAGTIAADSKSEVETLTDKLNNKNEVLKNASDLDKISKTEELVKIAQDRHDRIKKLIYSRPEEVVSLLIEDPSDFPDEARKFIEKKVEKKGFVGVTHIDLTNGGSREVVKLYDNDKLNGIGETLISQSGEIKGTPAQEVTISGFAFDDAVLVDPETTSIPLTLGYQGPVLGTRTMGVYYVGFANNEQRNLTRQTISTVVNGTLNSFINTSSGGRVNVVANVFDPDLFISSENIPLDAYGRCDFDRIIEITRQFLEANYINYSQYTDNLIVVDPFFECGYGGISKLGTGWMMTNGLSALSHEFGHNIGLGHASVYDCGDVVVRAGCPYDSANKDQEYGNFSDIMGANHAPVVSELDYGGYAKHYLGWLDSSEIADGSISGTFTIYKIEEHAPEPIASPYRVLRVPTFGGGPDYYIQYHTKYSGLNGPTLELASGELLDFRHTWLLDLTPGSDNAGTLVADFTDGYFRDGQEYYDPFNNIKIKQLSHDGSSSTLEVTRGAANPNTGSAQATWNRPTGYASAVSRKKDIKWPGQNYGWPAQTYVVSRRCTSTIFGCPTEFENVWSGTSLSTNITLTVGFSYEYKVEIYTKRDGDENQPAVYPWVDATAISVGSCPGGGPTCDVPISWGGVSYRAQLLRERVSPTDAEERVCHFEIGCQDDIGLLSDNNVSFRGLLAIDGTWRLEAKILVNDKDGNNHLLTRVLNLGTPDDYSASCSSQSSQLSCTIGNASGIGPFVGYEPILHSVKFNDADGLIIVPPERANASSSGSYFSGWGWDYRVEIFPDSFGSCAAAGFECQAQTIYGSAGSSFYITFNGLKNNTKYHWLACAYTCDQSEGKTLINEGRPTTGSAPGGTFFTDDPLKNLEAQYILPYTGEYFDNIDFTNKKLTRGEKGISFNWGSASPYSGIANTSYSARWTRNVVLPSGNYRFIISSDSGGMVYVDNVRILGTQIGGITAVAKNLTFGEHKIKVEYAHNTGSSRIVFSFADMSKCMDMTGDGKITSADLGVVASHFGSMPIDPNPWDVNGDKIVTSADLGLLASKFGTTC